ncbi:MAG TPA: carboxypeptidase-like regulatory domain-containing protein, partial [Bacteroidales bacterium]
MKKYFIVGIYAHKLSSLKKSLLIMKLTLLLIIVISFQATASVFPQQINLNQDTKGQTIRNVLNLIEKESHVRFFYNDDYKQLNEIVALNVSNSTLNEMLEQILSSANLTYKVIENNFVVIYPKESLQQTKVTGIVSDGNTGEPLAGVSILVENTTNGVTSGINGNYSIEVDANAVLLFSYIGYNPERIKVNGQTTLDVKLVPNMQMLDDVVVVGYGKSSRKNLVTAVTSVKSDNLNKGAISDVGQLIQGKVPGLNISASGDPNAPAAVILRGSSTVNSSNGP